MTSLNDKLRAFGIGLTAISPNCYHYWQTGMVLPYIVWYELGEESALAGNNKKQEQAISMAVHLFTKTEFDQLVDAVQEYLDGTAGTSWALTSAQYEDETGLIHYEWSVIIA